MVILIISAILFVGGGIFALKYHYSEVFGPSIAAVCVGGFLSLIYLIVGVVHYSKSLELEALRSRALTARQAVLKTHEYSKKSFSASGNVLGGELKVNYGVPLIRHKLEERAVGQIMYYNEELARMKGAKRGWLWTPAWGYSDVIDRMKPIDVPEMK